MIEKLETTLAEDTDQARECLRGLVGNEILVRPAEKGDYLEAQIRAGYLQ
ncbi:MAG: hypothetical protein AB1648_00255 [Pseudomonadota bacterium]|jgi:hypothetical protein